MELSEIRELVVVALFSDDTLADQLVLKGGNALELVHKVVARGSVDIDMSIPSTFGNVADIESRIFTSLRATFAQVGMAIFDETFRMVPEIHGHDSMPWWGGYIVEFKLIESSKYESLSGNLRSLRRQSAGIDLKQHRNFRIDISKYEYCEPKTSVQMQGRTIYVYTEEMCVLEKFRSICQQMPEYAAKVGKIGYPRARDFYDIYAVVTRRGLDLSLPETHELCRSIFAAKQVPLRLLQAVGDTREFHRPDWDAIKDSVREEVFDFDYYFDYVVSEAQKLKPLWVE